MEEDVMSKRCPTNYKWNKSKKRCEYDFPVELEGDYKVKVCGITKTRFRCPDCQRALDHMQCKLHGRVEPVDLMNASSEARGMALSFSILESIEGKDRVTVDEIARRLGASKKCIRESIKYIDDFQGVDRIRG